MDLQPTSLPTRRYTSTRCYFANSYIGKSLHLLLGQTSYFQQDATLHNLFISGKLLYLLRMVSPPIIRSTHNYIYSIRYLSNRYCFLPLLWKSCNWFECGVGIVLICFGAVADVSQQLHQNRTPER